MASKKIEKFIKLETLAGLTLALSAVCALIFANSSLATFYEAFLALPFEIRLGDKSLNKALILWINDGLMAVFFLLVALELKREILEGELSSVSQVLLPLVGAIGGILIPALFYYLCTYQHGEAVAGWAIPAATDIAFALAVVSLFGTRIPKSLKTFLLTLAVFDDLGAILIIAFFFTAKISFVAKIIALSVFLMLCLLNRLGVTKLTPYFLLGIVLWVCVLKSGVHATLAGVLLGFTIPLRAKNERGESPLISLEHTLHPWVAFMILPIFAFSNAGVNLSGVSISTIFEPIPLGIILGLVAGKTIGVFCFSMALIKFGKASLPEGATTSSFLAVSMISGIGFTMSLFIGSLAFAQNWVEIGYQVRIGVIVGSILSGLLGAFVLARSIPTAKTLD